MSEDLSEFIALSRPRRLECSVKTALRHLPAAQRRKVIDAFAADPGLITHQAISDWLKQHNVDVRANTIARHRKGRCSCAH